MATKDTELVNAFLADFVKTLTARFSDEIDFVLLFGSAARGEFRAGISDIDLIIQVKRRHDVGKVEKYAESIFWELDRKHETRLHEVCSTKRDNILSIFEKEVRLYKPFEVLGPDDIKWSEGKIVGRGLGTFAAIAPISQFARKVKREGKILYGRDILADMLVRETGADRIKAILVPYLFSLFALLLSPIMPDRALRYSIKAVLYAVDEQITLLEASHAKKTFLKMRILRAQLGSYYSVRLAEEALYAKKNFRTVSEEWSYIDKLAFCFQAPIHISYNNVLSLARFGRSIL